MTKGIILHAGHGTRLRPLTHTGPKQLLPVANKPMSQYGLEDLLAYGITDIAIIIGGPFADKVKEYYGDGSKFGVRITYVQQDNPAGIAHAVGLCKDFVGNSSFVVYLGDNILRGGLLQFKEQFEDSDAFLLLAEVAEPSRFGVAGFDAQGNINAIIEKPKIPPSNMAVIGVYFLRPDIFKFIDGLSPSWRGELEITEALQKMLASGKKISYDVVTGWWKDTGTPEDLLSANSLILDELVEDIRGKIEDDLSVSGRVRILDGAVIKKGAIIRGPAIIGSNTTIGERAYVGPYTSIGSESKIDNCEIENSIIMNNCEIDSNTRIVDSIVPDGCKISRYSNRLSGTRLILGERSRIFL